MSFGINIQNYFFVVSAGDSGNNPIGAYKVFVFLTKKKGRPLAFPSLVFSDELMDII